MAGFKVELFRGMRPRISAIKLKTGEAVTATNCDLGSGDARPFVDKSTEQAVTVGRLSRTIYKFDNADDPRWFEWNDYVDVVSGPVKDDSIERTYYTGDTAGNGSPKMTTINLATANGDAGPYPEDWRYMGVPAPVDAPTATATDLPEDVDSQDRVTVQARSFSDSLEIDFVDWTVYPGTGTRNQTWRLDAAAVGPISFDVGVGTSFRVTEVINNTRVRLESTSQPGIFARTRNTDKTTTGDWKAMDEQGTTQTADFIGWRIPVGCEMHILRHNLIVGDVITVSAMTGPIEVNLSLTTDAYEQDWETEVAITQASAATFYRATDAVVTPAAVSGAERWTIGGGFYYDVDRTASDSNSLEDRQYVYTYVTNLGEEGPPSEPSAVVRALDGTTVALSDMSLPPTIGYDITKIRIYRTNSTEAGTEYQFVQEVPISRFIYDTVASADLGEVIGSTTWDPPPVNLSGLTEMPNGMLVGFYGKNLYFCEPYFPHAWPAEYDQAVGHDIVGVAVFGNSLAVMTDGHPYIATGAHPRNINVRPVKFNQACINKGSIATDKDKVYYASPDGLVEIGVNGIRLSTREYIEKDEWASYEPATMIGGFHEGRYYGFYGFDSTIVDLVISAEISGTISIADETEVIEGGSTLIITLTNDLWVADGATFEAQRQNIIDGITAATSQTNGWNNILRDTELLVTHVVRTSDAVVTITLPTAATYSVTSDEVISVTVPATALAVSASALIAGSTFTVVAETPDASCSMGGTIDGATEASIVTGGDTLTLTLTSDTWVAAGATSFDLVRQAIIDGLVATDTQAFGWNAVALNEIGVAAVVRTSDLVVTITLPAVALYDIATHETVAATIPNAALTTTLSDLPALNSISLISSSGAAVAVISGTVIGATENDIVAGAKTIIITLTSDTWVAAGTGPIGTTAQSQALLDAILAITSQTLGWNNVVIPGIEVATDLVRTSATVATITLDAEATYSIATYETIGLTIPASVLTGAVAITAANTFGIVAQAPVVCTLSGTITDTIQEDAIVLGGNTIILTLASDTWLAAGTGPIGSTANTQAIIDGIDSAQAEAAGWDAEVKANLVPATDVVRTSDTVCTITLPAQAAYDITAAEVITATIPAAALNISASTVTAYPTIDIAVDQSATAALTGTALTGLTADVLRAGGTTIIITLLYDTWAPDGASFNAARQSIIDGLDAASSITGGWNNEVRDDLLSVTDVVRTSNTVVTITLPAIATYAAVSNEVITCTVPVAALGQSLVPVVATPTMAVSANIESLNIGYIPPFNSSEGMSVMIATNSVTDWAETVVDADTAEVDRTTGCILYGNGHWMIGAMAANTTRTAEIWDSTDDGVTWTSVHTAALGFGFYLNAPFNGMYHPDQGFHVLAGQGKWYYSYDDGVSWTEETTVGLGGSGFALAAPVMVYAGANYLQTNAAGYVDLLNGRFSQRYYRSADLSGIGTLAVGEWEEVELRFEGVDYIPGDVTTGSGNGKTLHFMHSGYATSTATYLSVTPHSSITESYVGEIQTLGLNLVQGKQLILGDTLWLLFAHGITMTCPVGSEETLNQWTYHGVTLDETVLGVVMTGAYFDPGNVSGGKEGLGFVAYGYETGTGRGVVYTSSDGQTWVRRTEWLDANSHPASSQGITSKYQLSLN